MAVKHLRLARVLATFEALADHQPVGVGALARVLDDDKSAVQRALMTLAAAQMRFTAPRGSGTRWEVTTACSASPIVPSARTGLRERIPDARGIAREHWRDRHSERSREWTNRRPRRGGEQATTFALRPKSVS